MSHFYGYYGYYFACKMKTGLVDGMGLTCHDHPEVTNNPHEKFCSYCGTELVQRQQEAAEINYHMMTQEGDGDLTNAERIALGKLFVPFSFPDDDDECLIPQSSKAFGVYFEDDDINAESKPPKVLGITETRKQLKKEFAVLRKHYKKVELKFGFMSDYC